MTIIAGLFVACFVVVIVSGLLLNSTDSASLFAVLLLALLGTLGFLILGQTIVTYKPIEPLYINQVSTGYDSKTLVTFKNTDGKLQTLDSDLACFFQNPSNIIVKARISQFDSSYKLELRPIIAEKSEKGN